MSVCPVTGYVELPDHPRPPDEYRKLLAKLKNAISDLVVFEDELKDCWMHQFLKTRVKPVTHSVADNPAKNTVAYHCVQAQKSAWIWRAANWLLRDNWDTVVWIDAGILHLPGVTELDILKFMRRAEYERDITIPGCWGKEYAYDDSQPCWRFCGGVMVVPSREAHAFHNAMVREYQEWIAKTNNLSWEVNTLARLEEHGYSIRHYMADHNASMFTAYRPARAEVQ